MLRTIRWLAIALLAVVGLGWATVLVAQRAPDGVAGRAVAAVFGHPPGGGAALPPGLSLGGPFQLVDQDGRPVTEQTWHGRWMLIYFGYTFCPDVCPTELQTIVAALHQLGPAAADIVPIFISIDPERDTPFAIGRYVALFGGNLVGLTGSPREIAQVAKAYRVYYAKVRSNDGSAYLMDHSSFTYLVGPDGRFKTLFPPGITAANLADGLREEMGRAGRSAS